MAAPKFKLNDIIYIAESAALGELDAYRIGSISQKALDVWVYQIFIERKPPAAPTVGDRIDLRFSRDLFYNEADLLTFCEAVDIAILNVQGRVNRANVDISVCEVSGNVVLPPSPPAGTPKFAIGSEIYIRSSANMGFLEPYMVSNVHQAPGVGEFTYQLDLTTLDTTDRLRSRPTLYFKERELLDRCEALVAQLAALDRKMSHLLALKVNLCSATS